jgi:hypothetical protein
VVKLRRGESMSAADLVDARWHKSSFSSGGGDTNCVEVTFAGPVAAFRDSKNTAGPVLLFPAAALSALLAATRH